MRHFSPSTVFARCSVYISAPSRSRSCRSYVRDATKCDTVGRVIIYEPPDSYAGSDGRITFDHLGIRAEIVKVLNEAFPSVKHPTTTQQLLIRAILSNKDVLLKDHTGTGKSFGILLALLNNAFKASIHDGGSKSKSKSKSITSLVIVPHRDLAYQFIHWVERIHSYLPRADPIASIVQAVVRNAADPLPEQILHLKEHPPRILIGTPPALLDLIQEDASALIFDKLSTVVVDEVDYLVESFPRNMDKYARLKARRQLLKHPSLTRQILNKIYCINKSVSNKKSQTDSDPSFHSNVGLDRPQLIMASATFRVPLRHFVLVRSGWFPKSRDNLIRIMGSSVPDNLVKPSTEDVARHSLGGSFIQHHALVVSEDGSIKNITGAADPPQPEDTMSSDSSISGHTITVNATALSPPDSGINEDHMDFESIGDDIVVESLPFKYNMLEAVSEAFALDVPRLALLVLPASAPLRRVVTALCEFGVDARNLDIFQEEARSGYLSQETSRPPSDNPTLLVGTLASIRGLDLPELTHVFILGLPEDRPVDTYLHAAGRVGRFGRGGKVISVLSARHKSKTNKGKFGWKDEPQKIQRMFQMMGVKPIKLSHFL
ncbi:uncharacterized protein FIBRA_00294 [Fibroporia radiculosa]|uniref:RNA helicase n=1 Tax=Fibroporia radiculosa TaxID=599839 RepID=J7RVB6_9APHY|nr:uncharacterized protein FIBRA_00294 [Fibroporia radiculosa]CCL98300.1 predicted protein [Fibroporia radiculosa]